MKNALFVGITLPLAIPTGRWDLFSDETIGIRIFTFSSPLISRNWWGFEASLFTDLSRVSSRSFLTDSMRAKTSGILVIR
jgi:hypothetical protein